MFARVREFEAVCNQNWIARKTFFLEMGWKRTLLCPEAFHRALLFQRENGAFIQRAISDHVRPLPDIMPIDFS